MMIFIEAGTKRFALSREASKALIVWTHVVIKLIEC